MGEIVKLRPRGCYTLAELPQREDIRKIAKSTGWEELDELWRLYPGQFVMVTGIAGHGKSTFVLNVVANMAHDFGVRSFLFVPENEQSIRDKMRLIWGERQGFKFFCENQCIVQSAVEDAFGNDPMDLRSVVERAVRVIEQDAIDVLVIDPWNELEHLKPREQLMTDYIRDALMWLKRICRHYAVTVILIAHPTKAVTENGGRVPNLSDIEGCYSDDTEVLSKRGWLHHGQITLSDEVACFDLDSSSIVYHEPSNILRKEFEGEMYRFRGNGYDLAVTPQHRMVVKPIWEGEGGVLGRPVRFPKGEWSFCRAQELPRSSFVIPLAGNPIEGAEPKSIQIGEKVYPADCFWRLVGWYVAEGHVGPCGLTWAQTEGYIADAFTAAFAEAGIPAVVGWQGSHGKGTKSVGRWYIGNRFSKELVEWFRVNCGEGAGKKQIPAAVFDLSPRLKRIFLKAYLEGDGCEYDGAFSAATISRKLCDDLQRLAVELGVHTSYCERAESGNAKKAYILRFGREGRREVALRTPRNVSRFSYNGLVWCLTVPTGAYVTRRKGRVVICGNSMNWYNKCDNGLIVHRNMGTSYSKVISAKVREHGAGRIGECHFTVDPNTGRFTPQPGGLSL